jgi:hypothetical protein
VELRRLRVNPPPPVAYEGGLERATPRWIKRQCIQTERFFEHALNDTRRNSIIFFLVVLRFA